MLTREELLKTAALAKLELSEDEIPALLREMEEIIAFAGRIDAAAPEDFPSLTGVPVCPLREDIPAPCFPQSEILREAGGGCEGFFQLLGRR